MKPTQNAVRQMAVAGTVLALALQHVTSPVSVFIKLRRCARRQHSWLRTVSDALRKARRVHRDLVADTSPFNQFRVAKSSAHIEVVIGIHNEALEMNRRIGEALVTLAPCLDEDLTFKERLDLLNCNAADFVEIEEGHRGMLYLMGVYCLEDSATHRRDEWNDRPLHSAVNAHVQYQVYSTPRGEAVMSEIFEKARAPGGVFHGVPTYFRQADGSMLRQAPSLVVHDAAGSRVVERTPS
ncbi:hypothetical protein [Massilia antarctica]|uniref:hypothetical protein n=1 Tax=Massilia antarctica TaxID=2765360 RepID=UPI0022705442|nr:hypothetical protein [Massilia sp. H27-R4]MCY0913229.1 hypothetical protein [Massilia sp. H27-R4]